MTPSELRVRRVSHRGHVCRNGRSIRSGCSSSRPRDHEFGIERLYLVSRGRRRPGRQLPRTDEKASFAKALLAALHAAKRGVTYNPASSSGCASDHCEIGWFGPRHDA